MNYIKEYEERMYNTIKEIPDKYQESGQISGSKVAQPALTAILTMLGVEKGFDNYTLAKFMRGHDVERLFVERVFGKPKYVDECGTWTKDNSSFTWQYDIDDGYMCSTCSIDVLEKVRKDNPCNDEYIIHEIKSVGKMKYDRVAGTGFRKGEPAPDISHCLQVSLYALSLDTDHKKRVLIHYVNADDYRVTSFEINPYDYKEELDKRIDAIYIAFQTKQLPQYVPYEPWQKGKYNSFPELENLSQDEVGSYVKTHYPEAYEKFMNSEVTEEGISYEK